MPNLEAIRLWVEDLRTTDAPQGKGRLRGYDGEDCCLARACEVYVRETGRGWWTGLRFDDGHGKHDLDGSSETALPEGVIQWFGVESCDPVLLDEKGNRVSCQSLNDSRGYTFAQIADALERTYLAEPAS